MTQPRVSVIIPTTHNRRWFNDAIFSQYIKQDHVNKELIWDFEDGTIGEKRNRCCEKATGEIIVSFDSDDNYAPDWISKSVEALITSMAHIVGLRKLNYWDEENKVAWQYTKRNESIPWVAGGTMCYWKEFWQHNKFKEINSGEDNEFVKGSPLVVAHNYIEGFLATIHSGNTSKKSTENAINWRRLAGEEEMKIKERWKL